MEAVPRLPMLSFELKISPVCPDFSQPFKRFISKYYGENGDLYDREIMELENLRNSACRAARDVTGCSLLKRYYCQIYSLFNRFLSFERHIGVQCIWADIYSGHTTVGDLDFELACILYNIGALHSELGANDPRQTDEEMKISCTHFQCSVWAFQHLLEDKKLFRSNDLSNDVLQFFVQIMLAQAQECILEKSMLDNRKPSIVAKVTAQVVEYYKNAITMLQQGAMNTSTQTTIIDVCGSKLFKQWKKFVEFKISYYDSICSLYMGNSTEDQQKMGERVAWYESAEAKLKQSLQLAKQLDEHLSIVMEAINFVSDVISVKLSNAKKENDFIYHEKVPPTTSLPEIKGISLVKGIPFNICDPEVSGPDIFARLVPIEAHEMASIYSARKDEILRNIRTKIEEKNQELMAYLSALKVEKETIRAPKEDAIPDELVNICAELSLNPEAIQEVETTLQQLDAVSEETGKIIDESRQLLKDEEKKEQEHQEKYGKSPPSLIVVELSKELSKHEETHKKAIESNRSLWENFEQHKDDIQVMTSSSASRIASILPSNKNVKFNEQVVAEMERLFDKIEEMQQQRKTLEEQLLKAMEQDNVMKLVLNHQKEEMDKVFENELKKYDKIVGFLEQNLSAQRNILRALTDCNAGYAETRKEIIEVQRNRKTRIASLLYTYQVFKELQINSKKGLEFYQKFQSIVTRLNARIRGVSKVKDEERAQFAQAQASRIMLSSVNSNPMIPSPPSISGILPPSIPGPNSSFVGGIPPPPHQPPPPPTIPPGGLPPGAKLKDYLPFMKNTATNRITSTSMPSMIPPSGPSSTAPIVPNKNVPNPMMIQPGIGPSMVPPPPPIPPASSSTSSSFAPSAPPPLTPTPPIVPSMGGHVTNMMHTPPHPQQPMPTMYNNPGLPPPQLPQPPAPVPGTIMPHLHHHVGVGGVSSMNPTSQQQQPQQYSPPPTYVQAISTPQVSSYSLPAIIGDGSSTTITTLSPHAHHNHYPSSSPMQNANQQYHPTIPSVIPINMNHPKPPPSLPPQPSMPTAANINNNNTPPTAAYPTPSSTTSSVPPLPVNHHYPSRPNLGPQQPQHVMATPTPPPQLPPNNNASMTVGYGSPAPAVSNQILPGGIVGGVGSFQTNYMPQYPNVSSTTTAMYQNNNRPFPPSPLSSTTHLPQSSQPPPPSSINNYGTNTSATSQVLPSQQPQVGFQQPPAIPQTIPPAATNGTHYYPPPPPMSMPASTRIVGNQIKPTMVGGGGHHNNGPNMANYPGPQPQQQLPPPSSNMVPQYGGGYPPSGSAVPGGISNASNVPTTPNHPYQHQQQPTSNNMPNGNLYQQMNGYHPAHPPSHQPQQQPPPPPTQNMVNNNNLNQPQINTNDNNNSAANITAILEQESKRGWQVLTPTPVNHNNNNNTVIKPAPMIVKKENDNVNVNNDAGTETSSAAAAAKPASSTASPEHTAKTLPDILSTMLNITPTNNGNQTNNNDATNTTASNVASNTNNSSTLNGIGGNVVDVGSAVVMMSNLGPKCTATNNNNDVIDGIGGGRGEPQQPSQQQSESTAASDHSNNDNDNNNIIINEPKDLLSQFDPLFT